MARVNSIYVLRLGADMVKFGISKNRSTRRAWYKHKGFPEITEEVWIASEHAGWVEGMLTRKFRQYRHIGREYLVGIEFDHVVETVSDLITTAEARANGFPSFTRSGGGAEHGK